MKMSREYIVFLLWLCCLCDCIFAQGRGMPVFTRRRPRPDRTNPRGTSPSRDSDPSRPQNRDPLRPQPRDPFQPRPRDPFRSRDPFQPRDRDPFQPRDRDPFQPRGRDPFQPRDRDPFQPRDRDPFQPRDRDPFQPRPRDPLRPQPFGRQPSRQPDRNRNPSRDPFRLPNQQTPFRRISPRPLAPRQNFRVASVKVEPFLFRNGTGYIPDLLNEMSRVGGFNYRITPYSQAILGIWNLLIEKVANREFDMAAGPITITRFRENFVDFTRAISRHKPHILVKSEDADVVSFAESLADSPGGITIGTLEDSAVLDHFQNSESPDLQRLYTQLRANQSLLAHTTNDALRKVRDGNYAFFVDGPIAEYLREQDPCELSSIPYGRTYIAYGLAVRKDLASSVKRMLDDTIYEIGRDGFLLGLKNRYFNMDLQCEDYYEDLL